jgi:hypothetical protein
MVSRGSGPSLLGSESRSPGLVRWPLYEVLYRTKRKTVSVGGVDNDCAAQRRQYAVSGRWRRAVEARPESLMSGNGRHVGQYFALSSWGLSLPLCFMSNPLPKPDEAVARVCNVDCLAWLVSGRKAHGYRCCRARFRLCRPEVPISAVKGL